MNTAIYTKTGELRKNPPPKFVFRHNQQPVPNKKLQRLNLPGISFLLGPNGERLDDNPDYAEWLRLKDEQDSLR